MRKITFRNAGVVKGSRVWLNTETGVEIIKGANFAEVGLYYVCEPTRDAMGRTMVSHHKTLSAARVAATAQAMHWRGWIIPNAYAEALRENRARSSAVMFVDGLTGVRVVREPGVVRESVYRVTYPT